MDFKPIPQHEARIEPVDYLVPEEQAVRDADRVALAPLGSSLYEYTDRPRRDNWATIAYLVLLGITCILSFVAFGTTDSAAIKGLYSNEFYQNSTTCNVKTFKQQFAVDTQTATWGSSFATSFAIWLPVSVIAGVAVSVGFLYMFRNHATKMVYASFIASVAISLLMAVIAFSSGATGGGVILLFFALVYAVTIYFIRTQLQLVGRLLSITGKGLQECPGIIPAAICVKLAGVGIMVFLFVGIVCGAFVGQVKPADGVLQVPSTPGSETGYCTSGAVRTPQGSLQPNYVACCTYHTEGWAGFYIFLACICISWTAHTLLSLKLYIVADVLSCWYFRSGQQEAHLAPSARRAARHGLTSSFGSVCFAGLILAFIEMLRSAMNNAQHNAEGACKIICCILNCFAQCILEILQQFTRFAVVSTAITGKGFVPAARDTYDTLKRNLLSTYSLWWIPDFVLGMTCFLITLTWACIVYFSTYLQWKDRLGDSAVGLAFAVAAVGLFALGFILYFLASIMMDGVNTIYVCFALDRDRKAVTHAEIHEVYLAVPSVHGALIQQPDGGVAYGAPSTQPPQQHPPPYASVMMTPYPTYPPAQPATQYPPPEYAYPYPAQPQGGYVAVPPAQAQYGAAPPATHYGYPAQPPPYPGAGGQQV